jgi:hypothetical protein
MSIVKQIFMRKSKTETGCRIPCQFPVDRVLRSKFPCRKAPPNQTHVVDIQLLFEIERVLFPC